MLLQTPRQLILPFNPRSPQTPPKKSKDDCSATEAPRGERVRAIRMHIAEDHGSWWVHWRAEISWHHYYRPSYHSKSQHRQHNLLTAGQIRAVAAEPFVHQDHAAIVVVTNVGAIVIGIAVAAVVSHTVSTVISTVDAADRGASVNKTALGANAASAGDWNY
jgi:hypothetical protein